MYMSWHVETKKPTIEDLNSYVITKYATDWYNIGIELKADVHKLDIIKQDNPQKRIVYFEKILDQWLQSNSDDVTWRTLEVALTNVNRANLGLKLVDVNGKNIRFCNSVCQYFIVDSDQISLCSIFFTMPVIYILYITTSNAIMTNVAFTLITLHAPLG